MAQMDYGAHAPEPEGYSLGAGALINFVGGIVSLALIAGVLVWGYQILARDVSGVPVVVALDGPMRKAPDNPGGIPASHQGLSVNEVAAVGTASAPRDTLVLAPPALSLAEEDAAGAVLVPASLSQEEIVVPEGQEVAASPLAPAEETDLQILLEELAATATPLEPLAPSETPEAEVVASVAPLAPAAAPEVAEPVAAPLPDLGPGVKRSLRPQVRPASFAPVTAQVEPSLDIDPADIPAGTRLVQLGAYDSAEVARAEWERIAGRFDSFMDGKQRVVQKAEKAGRTFYRLRAHGFDDVADARRFCSALVAQNAACIPVVQ